MVLRKRRSASTKELHHQCDAVVAPLDIPVPFDVRRLCEGIAESRGRPIRLVAMPRPAGSPCGMWVSTAETDYIIYEQDTSKLHQEHIIAHELGHLLSNHSTSGVLEAQAVSVLLPSLNPELVNRVLGRTHYSEQEEQTAELIATLILQRASRWRLAADWTAPEDTTGIRDRLGGSLERPDYHG